MMIAADVAIVLVAVLHGVFLVLEMFLWERPVGLRVFGMTKDRARSTRILAANQGLYNGFIAAGLLWGVIQGAAGHDIKVFFLLCVIVAGTFGGFTAGRKILYVQALPGLVALVLLWLPW